QRTGAASVVRCLSVFSRGSDRLVLTLADQAEACGSSRSSTYGAPPAGRVFTPCDSRVRSRADDGTDLELLVPLDVRFSRPAVGLAPHDFDLRADFDVRSDRR